MEALLRSDACLVLLVCRAGEGIQVGANGRVGTLKFVSKTEYESQFGKAETYTGWVKATQAGEPGYLLPESVLQRAQEVLCALCSSLGIALQELCVPAAKVYGVFIDADP